MKELKRAFIFCVAVIVLANVFWGSGDSKNERANPVASSPAASSEPEQEAEPPKYLEEISWASLENLLVAVEVDDYNGDVIRAGTWTARETCISNLGKGKVPIVWDICVVDGERVASGKLSLQKDDIVCTVGGWGAEDKVWSFDVHPGQYVAIIYNEMAGKPRGILKMELKK